jgi:hypothetical protein
MRTKTKRTIKPHKGGRSERVYLRCTPEIKAMLRQAIESTGLTAADLFEQWLRNSTLKS